MSGTIVKPTKEQDFKEFQVPMKEISWKMRCELNDDMVKASSDGTPTFSWWGNVVLKYTDLKEQELNKYPTDEIIAIANRIFELANKKT